MLACEQRYRTHLPQVEPKGVVGAARIFALRSLVCGRPFFGVQAIEPILVLVRRLRGVVPNGLGDRHVFVSLRVPAQTSCRSLGLLRTERAASALGALLHNETCQTCGPRGGQRRDPAPSGWSNRANEGPNA